MGYRRRYTAKQRDAMVEAVLLDGRTSGDVSRTGIPGLVPPGHFDSLTVASWVRQARDIPTPPVGLVRRVREAVVSAIHGIGD